MAEGFLRAYGGDRFAAESAGTVAGGLHPLAVQVMAEIGIDISGHRSRSVNELAGAFDVCVTVCDANCPIPPRAGLQLRWQFADPAQATGTAAERLAAFRLVRDGIGKRVRALIWLDGTPAALHVEPTDPPPAGRTAGGRVMPDIGQGLPPRPGEIAPPSVDQGKPVGAPIDQPLQPAPQPKQDPPPTM